MPDTLLENVNVTVKQSPVVNIEKFDPKVDRWNVYRDRLENFFTVMRVTEDREKSATLLSCVGASAYKVVHDMCSPELPSSKPYADLCTVLKEYFDPHIVPFLERKKFYSAARNAGESIVEWVARIKYLAANCDFGDKLSFVVVDKFVTSTSGKAFDRISEEKMKDLTLKKAVELAVKYEKSPPVIETVTQSEESPSKIQKEVK